MAWKYYGRTSGVKVYEIYRAPDNGKEISEQAPHLVERLHANGLWSSDPNDNGIWNEMLSGWFDDGDAMSESEMKRYLEAWQRDGWPGRP
jgi:hypothetical protein